jgi:hypothetical protein
VIVTECVLTLREVSERYDVSYSTAHRWATRGVNGIRLEAVRLGRRFITSVEALERWGQRLADATRPPDPERPTATTAPAAPLTPHLPDDAEADDVLQRFGIRA